MDLSNRHYSKQSHMLVNAKYALTKNGIDFIFDSFWLGNKRRDDKDFPGFMFLPLKRILGILNSFLNKMGTLKAG